MPEPSAGAWDIVVLTTAWPPDAGDIPDACVLVPFTGEQSFRRFTEEALVIARAASARSPKWLDLSLLDLFLAPLADSVFQLIVALDLFERVRGLCGSNPVEIVVGGDMLSCRAFAEAARGEDHWHVRDCSDPRRGVPGRAGAKVRRLGSLVGSTPLHLMPKELTLFSVERYDRRYKVRGKLGALRARPQPSPGGNWGFSTYENYTRALCAHEARKGLEIEGDYSFLVGNHSARRPLSGDRRNVWSLWSFPPSRYDTSRIPDRPMISLVETSLPSAVSGLLEDEPPLTLLRQPWYLRRFMLELGMLASFFDTARPSCFVTGNQYSPLERAGLVFARMRGVPSVQLMHGTLEKYYLSDTVMSDEFVVAGAFWRELLPLGERSKCSVPVAVLPQRKPYRDSSEPTKGQGKSESWTALDAAVRVVTWFTGPIGLVPFATTKERPLLVGALLQSLLECPQAAMIVRVHPAEQPADYRKLVASTARELALPWQELAGRIHFSQRTPIRPLAERTGVAFMHLSTTFTECLASGVPVISPGWYHSSISETLENCGVLIRPKTLPDLTEALARGLRGTLPYHPSVSANDFLA